MNAAKFAISMPAETMKHVQRAAKRLGVTRSRFIALVLDRVAQDDRNWAISKKVDEALAAIGEQDSEPVRFLQSAGRKAGTEW